MAEKIDINFNEDDLTLGDMEDFENIAGQSLLDALAPKAIIGPDGRPVRDEDGRPLSEVQVTAKALIGLVYITLRRDDPTFTVAQARNIKVGSLNLGGEDDPALDESVPTRALDAEGKGDDDSQNTETPA